MMKNISNVKLTKYQNSLMRKMIAFDSLELGFDEDKIKHELYKLFFEWHKTQNQQIAAGIGSDLDGTKNNLKKQRD